MPIFDPLSVFDPRQLHESIDRGEIDYLKSLLKFGINVNKRGHNEATALHIATINKKAEIVKLLLEHGADPEEKNEIGETALQTAMRNFDKATIQVLLDSGAEMIEYSRDNLKQIHIAAICGDESLIKKLLSLEVDLEEKYCWSYHGPLTALQCAARMGHEEIVENLLENTIISEDFKMCALHSAALGGNIRIAKRFMELGCDVQERDEEEGNTTLHYAARGANPEMIEFIVRQGIDINVKNDVGENVLFSAIQHYSMISESVIGMLLKLGISINETDENGDTPLKYAADIENTEAVKVLLKLGATIGPTLLVNTPPHTNIVSLLLNHGANVNQKDACGRKLLLKIMSDHCREYSSLESIAEELINHGAQVETDNSLLWKFVEVYTYFVGDMFLEINDNYFRSLRGNKGIVKKILQHGANVNYRNEQGISVFEHALYSNCFHEVFILPFLDFGLDVNRYYGEGRSMIQFTLDHGKVVVAKVITRHMIKMKHQSQHISADNLAAIQRSNELNYFWDCCEVEVTKMKAKNGFYNLFVSQSSAQLAELACRRGVERVLVSQRHKTMFPIYADHLEEQFEKGAKTVPLLHDVNNFFHAVADSEGNEDLTKLPDPCIYKIFEFLKFKDLETLAYVCNPKRR